MYAENYIRRYFLQGGLGEVDVGHGDFVGLVDLDELCNRLGNHGAARFERLGSLRQKNVRRRNARTEGPSRYLDSLEIGDMQKVGFIRDRGKVVGLGDASFLFLCRDL